MQHPDVASVLAVLDSSGKALPDQLRIGNIVFRENRLNGAFGHAQRAVDALIWIDDEDVRTFAKTVDRAHINAIGILAFDAALDDDVGHILPVSVSCAGAALNREF